MFIRFTTLFFLFVLSTFAGATQYNDTLLTMHSKTAVKLALMDNAIEKKLIKSAIVLTVVYDKKDESVAKTFKEMINVEYANGIQGKEVTVVLKEFKDFTTGFDSTMVYVMRGQKDSIEKVAAICIKSSRVTFSYESDYLKHKIILSLFIEKKTSPYINLQAAKESGITFRDLLLRVSKIYEGEP